jgi:RNA polymerase sigma-70 factor (ECF subfamily)
MDATTFARLIDRYAAALVLYARQWCAAPEDVVQDAFLALMARATFPDPVAPWLFRVVRNRAISSARSDQRRRRREQDAGLRRPAWFRADPAGELDAAALRDALAELPAQQREVIVAHLWGGLTFEQVAALAGVSTSMAYRHYSAGVEALRARLGGRVCPRNPTT